jgi:hypothetical protein
MSCQKTITESSAAPFPQTIEVIGYRISAIRMMIGIGTPSSHNKIERMIASGSGLDEDR